MPCRAVEQVILCLLPLLYPGFRCIGDISGMLTLKYIAEAIRILGIKWLPTGNAKKDVSVGGRIQENHRKPPDGGDMYTKKESHDAEGNSSSQPSNAEGIDPNESGEDEAIAGGMEAEEGNFVNVEVGFSYRASNTGTSMKVKAKNAHLYLLFYLPGGIRFRKLKISQ